jgi:very-short-patch-repair endonuclease
MMGHVGLARKLRRNQTDAARLLWSRLRNRQIANLKFKRQVAIDRYVVDFCCSDARLIVELDGGQHAIRLAEDANRTKALETMGYLVLRFWNNDVTQNLEGVLEEILNTVKQHLPEPPHPDPLPSGERGQGA